MKIHFRSHSQDVQSRGAVRHETSAGEFHIEDLHAGTTHGSHRVAARSESRWHALTQKGALLAFTAMMALPSFGLVAQAAQTAQTPVATLTATPAPANYKPENPCAVFCWNPVDVATHASLEKQFPMGSTYTIPGKTPWFDHAEYYAPGHELFIAREDQTQVINTQTGDLYSIKTPNTNKAHGIGFDQADGRGFISNGNSNTVTIFDLHTLQPIKDVKVGKKPDNVVFDPASKLAWVMIAGDKQAIALDPMTGNIVHKVDLQGSHPEMARVDGKGNLFIALSDSNYLAQINTLTGQLIGAYPLAPSVGPSAMSIDPVHNKLFIGSDNHLAIVFDTQQHKVVAQGKIGDADSSQFNPQTGQAFFSNADGSVSVVGGNDQTGYKVEGTFFSVLGAKTMAIDQTTGTMYIPGASTATDGHMTVGVVTPAR